MKFTPDTLTLLKNFSTINESIVIDPGNQISTRAPNKTVFAVAEVVEDFKDELAIYNLPQFLNIFTMFKDASLDTSNGRQASIREGKKVVRYTFAEPSLIVKAPKGIKEPEAVTTFELKAEELQTWLKMAAVMGLPDLYIKGDGSHLFIGATDEESPSSNTYNFEIGETDKIFSAFFKIETFKQLTRDYRVIVTERFAKFESIDKSSLNVSYWIAVQLNSRFS